jgi:hypothetical protein
MPSTPVGQPSIDPSLIGMVTEAVADLAGRLGVGPDAISVLSAELVTWSDASAGCAEKGRLYPQVVTDGSKIVLARGSTRYEYHTGGAIIVPFLCTTPSR